MLKSYLPILDWLPNYKKEYLSGDLSAGVTVGIMLIPQGMAYAMIAGLPPVYGLFAAIMPQVIYSLFGTSRQLAVGPVAMDSLIVAAGVSAIAQAGTEHYIEMTILLSLMMGVIQLSFGVFKMGFIVNFLSKPVISGFTSAAALIIGINQLKHVLGLNLERSHNIFKIIGEAMSSISSTNLITFGIGLGAIATIVVLKKINKRIPSALIVVALFTTLSYFLKLENSAVKIIGIIPEGLPEFKIPNINLEAISELSSIAVTLALIAFMEAISISKNLQAKHKNEYKLNNNQEMIGLGMGNIIGSMFSSYPTTGGFGRSAVNEQAGARTNLANLISAGIIAITLLFLTPLFYHLPQAILGAIVMVAVFGLIDTKYPRFLWKVSSEDFAMFAITFSMTLIMGIKEGIIAGVIVSIIAMVYRNTKPHIAVLGPLPNSTDYRNVNRFENIELRDDVLVVRHDAQLFFANIDNFTDTLKQKIAAKGDKLQLLVIHCGGTGHIDATALASLKDTFSDINKKGIKIKLSGVIGPVRDFLERTDFAKEFGPNYHFKDVNSAIVAFDNEYSHAIKAKFDLETQSTIFEERDI